MTQIEALKTKVDGWRELLIHKMQEGGNRNVVLIGDSMRSSHIHSLGEIPQHRWG